MVINYKPLNQYLVPRKFPIPLKDDLLCRIPNATTFSKLDLKSGFWQFKIHRDHRYKTVFIIPQGQYQWISMPFGLKTAHLDCQQWVDKIFAPIAAFCLVYLDDILIFSSNMAQHIKHLKEFLKLLQQTGLVLSTTKCVFGVAEFEFLGILIRKGRIKLQSHVLEKIASFPPKLHDLKEL